MPVYSRRTKVSGNNYGWIIPVAVVAIGGYLAYTYLGSGSDQGANNSSIDTNTADTAASSLQAAQAAGQTQTVSDSVLNGYATTLFQLIGNGGDHSTIINTVDQVNNEVDWYRLVQLFGTKKFASTTWGTCSLFGFGCDSYDLPSALKMTLTDSEISNLNTYFSDQGMNVQL